MNDSEARLPTEIALRIFVVGVPRAGTTLVQSLLAAHRNVASWTESHLFARHFRLVPGFLGRAFLARDPTRAVADFLRENNVPDNDNDMAWFESPATRRSLAWFLRPRRSVQVARAILKMFDDLAAHRGCSAWVEKTPAHLRYIPFLERIDESPADLRFVHVLRDGLATVSSLHHASAHWERRYSVPECVSRWNAEMRLSLSRAGKSSDVFVFYEDLLQDPEAASRRLLDELGLPWQEDLLDRRQEASDLVTAGNERAWKAEFDRAIGPSNRSAKELTPSQLELVAKDLDHDLYPRLRRVLGLPDSPGFEAAKNS